MALPPYTLVSLCDGYGGTELALRSVAPVRTVARVERDAYAAAVLVARMEETRLDQAPIWDDLCTFDGTAWRGRVDIVAAGFPCPDFSAAGRRAGVDGEHWLWPEVSRVIGEVEPSFVLLENVPGLVGLGGLTRVCSDLALYGFDAEWGLLSASAVGAPHERQRFWLVAHTNDGRRVRGFARDPGQWSTKGPLTSPERRDTDVAHTARRKLEPARIESSERFQHDASGRLADVGHASSSRRPEIARGTPGDEGADGRQPHRGHVIDGASEDVADTTRVDEREPHHKERPNTRRDTRTHPRWRGWPPSRDDHAGWQQWINEGGPEPVIRRNTDGPPPGLADALHLGGNGLVPQCAAEAWTQLLNRGGWNA